MRLYALLLALVVTLTSSQTAQARTWTDQKGKTLEGEVVTVTEAHVILKTGDADKRLPIRVFSAEDQKYLKRLYKEQEAKRVEAELAARFKQMETEEEQQAEATDEFLAEQSAVDQEREARRVEREAERAERKEKTLRDDRRDTLRDKVNRNLKK